MPRFVFSKIGCLCVVANFQFTKKACEQIGVNFELRLVGEARAGMDGEGVGIDVEEAILEVCSTLSCNVIQS